MSEVFNPFEKIRLPAEKKVWGMFVSAFPQGFRPGSIALVGDDGTLADLAAESYAESKIIVVDRSAAVGARLRGQGRTVISGDIRHPDTVARIVNETSGGADAVFMKHGVYLNSPANQKIVVAGLFNACRQDGMVGFSAPTAAVGYRYTSRSALEPLPRL